MTLTRREWLALAGAASLARPAVAISRPERFAAAWDSDEGPRVGVLERSRSLLKVRAVLPVPTRAHGLLLEPGGALLAMARRPGDWMVRWQPGSRNPTWAWAEPGRVFNGHVLASGDRLFTTETNLETGQGLVGVRHTASLRKMDEWPTHGQDPHALLLDADGSLLVANGGIATVPESGRAKLHLDRMDSSLVRLAPGDGKLGGQWRLQDQRLSLRHLAWASSGSQPLLGVALQAEHDDAQAKAEAPVLALFDGDRLRPVSAPQPLAGYGGDIAAVRDLFIVSCPRSHGVALFELDGSWRGFASLPSACALAGGPGPGPVWAAGSSAALPIGATTARLAIGTGIRLDNHWLALTL